MSRSTIVLVAGAAITSQGVYDFAKAKTAKERNKAMLQSAIGVAVVAVGLYLGYHAEDLNRSSIKIPPIYKSPNCEEAKSALESVLANGKESSKVNRFIGIVEKNQGITCENYLPWKDSFHRGGTGYIDGINTTDLKEPVVWGIERW